MTLPWMSDPAPLDAMPSRRRAVLLAILAVALSLYLLNSHDSPRQLAADLRDSWRDVTGSADSSAIATIVSHARPVHPIHLTRHAVAR